MKLEDLLVKRIYVGEYHHLGDDGVTAQKYLRIKKIEVKQPFLKSKYINKKNIIASVVLSLLMIFSCLSLICFVGFSTISVVPYFIIMIILSIASLGVTIFLISKFKKYISYDKSAKCYLPLFRKMAAKGYHYYLVDFMKEKKLSIGDIRCLVSALRKDTIDDLNIKNISNKEIIALRDSLICMYREILDEKKALEYEDRAALYEADTDQSISDSLENISVDFTDTFSIKQDVKLIDYIPDFDDFLGWNFLRYWVSLFCSLGLKKEGSYLDYFKAIPISLSSKSVQKTTQINIISKNVFDFLKKYLPLKDKLIDFKVMIDDVFDKEGTVDIHHALQNLDKIDFKKDSSLIVYYYRSVFKNISNIEVQIIHYLLKNFSCEQIAMLYDLVGHKGEDILRQFKAIGVNISLDNEDTTQYIFRYLETISCDEHSAMYDIGASLCSYEGVGLIPDTKFYCSDRQKAFLELAQSVTASLNFPFSSNIDDLSLIPANNNFEEVLNKEFIIVRDILQ